jgi:hypothetical protein
MDVGCVDHVWVLSKVAVGCSSGLTKFFASKRREDISGMRDMEKICLKGKKY